MWISLRYFYDDFVYHYCRDSGIEIMIMIRKVMIIIDMAIIMKIIIIIIITIIVAVITIIMTDNCF